MASSQNTPSVESWSLETLIQEFEEHDYIQRDWEKVRPLAIQILLDLKANSKVDFYLFFGRCPRKIVDNYNAFIHAERFGYTIEDMKICEYGWASFDFEEQESICVYQSGNNVLDLVEYHIARSRNDLFVTGCSFSACDFGSYSSPHIYAPEKEIFHSKKEAEIFIVAKLLGKFEEATLKHPKSKYCFAALKALKDHHRKLVHGEIVQLQLFV